MAFETVGDAKELLVALREAGLGWIADQVEAVIGQGKSIDREFVEGERSRKRIVGLATVPFGPEEQLDIALGTIQTYTEGLHKTWKSVQLLQEHDAGDSHSRPWSGIDFVAPGETQPVQFYGPGSEQAIDELSLLLRRVRTTQPGGSA